jgi:hypothetical protein
LKFFDGKSKEPKGSELRLTLWDKLKLWRIVKDETVIEKLKSRKLWVAVISSALVVFSQQLGIDPELTNKLVAIAGSYILGQGLADMNTAKK